MPDRPTTTPDLAAAIRALAMQTAIVLDVEVDALDEPHRSLLRAILAAVPPEPPPSPVCGALGSGPGWRGFVRCQRPPGHEPPHAGGHWVWLDGQIPRLR